MTNPVSPVSAEELLDDDGENLAVRAFLSLYGCTNVPSTDQMRRHLVASGFDECWPDWAAEDQHLTKGGAQAWIRHLFALEGAPAASGATPEGYSLVPMVPTQEMRMAGMEESPLCIKRMYEYQNKPGAKVSYSGQSHGFDTEAIGDIYAAMIAAAPIPPDPNAGND